MKRRSLILIAGPAGAGKTFLAHRIRDSIAERSACVISLDWFFRDRSSNYDLPDSIDLPRLLTVVGALENGASVSLTHKEHGLRVHEPAHLVWTDVLIIEGLFAFRYAELMDRAQLRVYVSTHHYLCGARRILRDVLVNQDLPDDALAKVQEQVIPSISELVAPQRPRADVEFAGNGDWPALLERVRQL